MKKNRDELKARFKKNSKPTESDFENFLDSYLHKDDTLPNADLLKASQLEAEQGTENSKYMTPLRTFQAIKKLVRLENLAGLKSDVEALINAGGGQPAFGILDVEVIANAGKLKATIVVTNALNLSLQYSIDDVTYQTANVFENLTSTNYFYVRQANNFAKKVIFQKKVNILPTIASLEITQTGGSSYKVIVNASNPNSVTLEYKLDTGLWQSSNTFTGVSQGLHTFSLRNTATITEGDSIIRLIGASSAPLNVVPKLALTAETMWNHFSPNLIPDFAIPTKQDNVMGRLMPVKWFIWDMAGRNNFGTTGTTDADKALSERTNMFAKGITAIEWNRLRDCLEREVDTNWGPACYVNGTAPVVQGYLLACGRPSPQANEDGAMSTWIDWAKVNVDLHATRAKTPMTNGKYDLFLTLPDYQSRYSGPEENDYITALMYGMLERTNGYVGTTCLNAIINYGVYVNEDSYNGNLRHPNWSHVATSAAGVYQGNKIQGNPNVVSVVYLGQYFESYLPQGQVVKDQNGNNWFQINHFGGIHSAGTNFNTVPNINHWAATVGGLIETTYDEVKAGGNKILVMLENSTRVNGGYYYHPNGMQYRDNKYIQEFNRYGDLVQGTTGDYLESIHTETIPNFMSEGEVLLSYFSGAKGVKVNRTGGNDSISHPKDAAHPRRGQKYNDPDWGNNDYENIIDKLHAQWRCSQKVQVQDGNQYSFFDICDDTEVYLNMNTEVNYGAGYVKYRALDWALYQKTAVRAVVNLAKNVIFILAFQPYGVEQNSITIRYNLNGKNFIKTLTVPVGQLVIEAYNLS